ncbi:MAG: hypothetical protein AB2A00_11830 [Myxococcota bacterium]
MSDKVGGNRSPATVWPWPVSNPTLGITAEEIRVQKPTPPKDPSIQPIPEARATEFLAPTTNSEHLRLSPPAAANPLATAVGPQHDHIMVRVALGKARGANAQDLHKYLQSAEAAALPEDRRNQMKASLAREQALMTLMRSVHEMQEGIYARVIGTSEA